MRGAKERTSRGRQAACVSLGLAVAFVVAGCGRPTRVTLVLRCDDYGSDSATSAAVALTGACARCRAPVTIGVVPFRHDTAGVPNRRPMAPHKVAMLQWGISNGFFDVVQHGLSHDRRGPGDQATEFAGCDPADQARRINEGRAYLERRLDQPIRYFAPPWDTFDGGTLRALRELGFAGLTAEPLVDGVEGLSDPSLLSLRYAPVTTVLPGLHRAMGNALASGDPDALVMVLLHGRELRNGDGEAVLTGLLEGARGDPRVTVSTVGAFLDARPAHTVGHAVAAASLRQALAPHRAALRRWLRLDVDRLLPEGVFPSPAHLRAVRRAIALRASVAAAAFLGLIAAAVFLLARRQKGIGQPGGAP